MARRIALGARLLTLPAILALGMPNTPAVSAGNPCFHGYEMPPSSTGPGTDIKLMPCAFVPTVTVIAERESVTFVNGPEYTHLVTGAVQEWGSAETEIQPNQSVTYTFDDAGIYPYACALHPGMSGAIVVGDLEDAVAVGAAGAVTSVDTTDTSAGAASQVQTDESTVAETATTQSTDVGTLALVGLGTGAGIVVGAAAIWLAMRRRQEASGLLARAE